MIGGLPPIHFLEWTQRPESYQEYLRAFQLAGGTQIFYQRVSEIKKEKAHSAGPNEEGEESPTSFDYPWIPGNYVSVTNSLRSFSVTRDREPEQDKSSEIFSEDKTFILRRKVVRSLTEYNR